VLVRHYLAGPTPPVPPQLVDEVYYAPATVLGPDGPVDVPMPRTIAALRDLPPSAASEDQPLAPCPFAGAPTDTPPNATAELLDPEQFPAGGDRAAAPTPDPAERSLRVRNAYGERIKTDYADGERIRTVLVPPGHETLVLPGQVPAPPEPIGTFAARAAARLASAAAADRAAREVAAAEPYGAADTAVRLPPGLAHLPILGAGRLVDVVRLLTGAPLPADTVHAQGLLSAETLRPCTTVVGGSCPVSGKGIFGECTRIGSMSCLVRLNLASAGLAGVQPLGPRVQIVTNRGPESLACAVDAASAGTLTCTGMLVGEAGFGAPLAVLVAPNLAVDGTVGAQEPNALLEPPVRSSVSGVLNTTLAARNAKVNIAGLPIATQTFEGIYPGPTLRFRPGDLLRINLVNQLSGVESAFIPVPVGNQSGHVPGATNLHIHGMHVSPLGSLGDNVLITIPPGGASNQYAYPIPLDQSPGLYWYHPHFHGTTQAQVFAGMMGALIVEGALDRLPGIAGVPERLMVIHQIQLDGMGGVVPAAVQDPLQVIRTINSQYQPTIHMFPGQTQRWRLANTSSDGTIVVRLNDHLLYVIATDGNTFSAPVAMGAVTLPPASRAEVLVQCLTPGRYALRSLPYNEGFSGNDQPEALLGTVVCDGPVWEPLPIPTTLLPVTDLRTMPVARRRTVVFSEPATPSGGINFLIDGQLFDPFTVHIQPKLGTVEEWVIRNPSPEAHAFHIHINPFQVTAINGVPYNAPGYNDTFAMPIDGEFTFLTQFADFVGTFVIHCHILGHEDAGMMATVRVDP
jgi:FtsP/CotA-like multicopper oxidase with cupredoxin domain